MTANRIVVEHPDVSGRRYARALRETILRELGDGASSVVLDLSAVRCASDSFLDELFGVLVLKRGPRWFRDRVKLIGVRESVRVDIVRAAKRRMSSAAPEFAQNAADE